jgi:FkbM family methyltransferase
VRSTPDTPRAERFRSRTLVERLAQAFPSGGALAPVRRWLKPLFERALAGRRGGLRSVLPGGEVLLVAPAFRHVTWNGEEYEAFRAAVRPGDTVLEAGTNVGAYTMLFGRWIGPGGHVHAFEPDPQAFRGLEQHLALNGLRDRVTPVAAAIADDRTPRLRFAMFESSGISRMASDREQPGTAIREVPAWSIDRYCADHGIAPTVIKIDVEGAELAALRGARATIAAAGSRLRLFVEMHPQLWPAFGISADDVRRECDAQGLTVERLDGSATDLWTIEGVCLRLRPHAAS